MRTTSPARVDIETMGPAAAPGGPYQPSSRLPMRTRGRNVPSLSHPTPLRFGGVDSIKRIIRPRLNRVRFPRHRSSSLSKGSTIGALPSLLPPVLETPAMFCLPSVKGVGAPAPATAVDLCRVHLEPRDLLSSTEASVLQAYCPRLSKGVLLSSEL